MKRFFVVLFCSLVSLAGNAQENVQEPPCDSLYDNLYDGFKEYLQRYHDKYKEMTSYRLGSLKMKEVFLKEDIGGAFYRNHFGFFCKKEWELEQQTKVPLRVRLGGLSITDRLEGKE
ncbi:hypothetical protein [Chitinophaga caeni]|uniref:hypothetical protein n=1 Tax=Chitinophaga caeni TaxID=2029983 RepID=UPI0012FDDF45|nr:hypothetical protein [Chitinophaga caeni]